MPMRTEPSASPGLRTHSCSLVYLRSSGYTALLRSGSVPACCVARRLSGRAGPGVLRCRRLHDRGDLDLVGLPGLDASVDVGALDLVDEATFEVERGGQVMGAADGLDDVGRAQHLAVDEDSPVDVLERALGHDPDPVVELDRLRAGVP